MWESRAKDDLIIEVWEKLDCENVGRPEIEAITEAVRGRFGEQAVDPPMMIARLLSDEGAELRHSEIMDLHIEFYSEIPYEAEFRNLFKMDDLHSSLSSIRNLENLRRKFTADDDPSGLRQIRERAIAVKKELEHRQLAKSAEAAEWLTLWLQSPEIFEQWIKHRLASADFISRFGEIN